MAESADKRLIIPTTERGPLTYEELIERERRRGRFDPIRKVAILPELRPMMAAEWCDGSTKLQVNFLSTQPNVLVGVRGIMLGLDSKNLQLSTDLRTVGNGTVEENTIVIPIGFLRSVLVKVFAQSVVVGELFVTLKLLHGISGSGLEQRTLTAGYVSYGKELWFPETLAGDSLSGEGNLRQITGTNPGAGNEISETVPTGRRWKLRYGIFLFTTSSTVQDRTVRIAFDDGAVLAYLAVASDVIPPSASSHFTFGPVQYGTKADVDPRLIPIPESPLLTEGMRWSTNTLNLKFNDNYSAPTFLVEEWLVA